MLCADAEPLSDDFQPLDPRGGAINTGDAVDIAGFGVVAENRRNTARTLRQAHLVSIGSLQVANRVTVVTDRVSRRRRGPAPLARSRRPPCSR